MRRVITINNLPGKATHYRTCNRNVGACGIVAPEYAAYDARDVDCKKCMKSRAWLNAMGRTASMDSLGIETKRA